MIGYEVTQLRNNPRFRSASLEYRVDNYRNFVKDNKRNQILFRPHIQSLRKVPAFSIQTEQFNTKPFTPAGNRLETQKYLFAKEPSKAPDDNLKKFQRLYEDCRFPIRVLSNGGSRKIQWEVDPNKLNSTDRRELLRRFAVGLPVETQPYRVIAYQGFKNLLSTNYGPVILAECLIDVIPNLRKGLNSSKLSKKLEMLELLRQMTQTRGIGPLLVPYYRMLLPPLRIVKSTRISTDVSTSTRERLINSIEQTLHALEITGGENAFINIKYLIPQYQSTL